MWDLAKAVGTGLWGGKKAFDGGAGLGQVANGSERVADGDSEGIMDILAGGLGTLGSVNGIAGVFGALGLETGAIGLGSVLGTGGATTATVAGSGLAAAPWLAAAGGTGLAVGTRGNSFAEEHLGQSWSDMSADAGVGAYEWASEAGAPDWLAHTAGIGTTLGASVLSVPGAAVTGLAGFGEDIGSGISSAWDWAFGD